MALNKTQQATIEEWQTLKLAEKKLFQEQARVERAYLKAQERVSALKEELNAIDDSLTDVGDGLGNINLSAVAIGLLRDTLGEDLYIESIKVY